MTGAAIRDLVHQWARDGGDRVALVVDDRRVTYAQLAGDIDRVAMGLTRSGVTPGDRVVVFLPNSVDAVTAIFGVWRAGGCVVMADAESTPEHFAYRVHHSGASAVVTAIDRVATVRAAAPAVAILVPDADDTVETTGWTPPRVEADSPAAIIYTSGSTGSPKGVTHSHRSIGSVVEAVAHYLDHTADDIVLCVLQLSFGYGLLQVLVTYATGGRLVLRRGVGLPYDLVEAIEAHQVTGMAGVPTLFAVLRDLGPDALAKCRSLRYLTCAAAAMPESLARQTVERFPTARLFVMHGQTECLRTTYLPPELLAAHPTSVGRGMPGVELWLESPDGQRLDDPAEGELVVRGENVMLGYWNDPEATDRVVRPGRTPTERVLRTGDLFRTDAEGWFSFVSRSDDIIKTRGEKVSPHEVEQALSALDEVAECRVLGIADDLLGQAVRAEIVLREGSALSERDVRRALRQRLETYKVPRDIVFVDSLPKSTSGKVLRRP